MRLQKHILERINPKSFFLKIEKKKFKNIYDQIDLRKLDVRKYH
jgi:hypothetical protein